MPSTTDTLFVTPAALERLRAEVAGLRAQRPALLEAITTGFSGGDSADQAAFAEQIASLAELDARIELLETRVANAVVTDVRSGSGSVQVGSVVTVRFDGDDADELFVVGVSVESSIFTGPETRALPAVTLHLQASAEPGGPVRNLRVHFQASGMEAIGDAIADAAGDAIARADSRSAHSASLAPPTPTHYDVPVQPSSDDGATAARDLIRRLRDVWELVESEEPYPGAVPFLLEALHGSAPDDVHFREGVVRALSIKQARPHAAAALVHEMRRQQEHDEIYVLWAFGNALSIVADEDVYDDIVALARDRSLGRAREMLMEALGRMDDPGATQVLLEFVDDDDVDAQALVALARRADAPREVFERFADDEREWVRRAARRRLAG
jgi:hypothetical protein